MIEIAQARNEEDPSFWNSVGQSDVEMVILLAKYLSAPEHDAPLFWP